MPNLNYERGRAAEYKAIAELQAAGYNAIRTAGSHSCADVIAWNEFELRLIQIKTYKVREGDYRKDIACLERMPLPPSTHCEIWTKKTRTKGWTRQERISSRFSQPSTSEPVT